MDSTETVKPRKAGIYIALGIVAAWLAFLALALPHVASEPGVTEIGPPRHDPRVRFDWPLTDIDGEQVDFASYHGKPLFVNIWASWCAPCKAELPSILALSDEAAVRDVEFLLISTGDERLPIRRYLDAHRELTGGRITYLFCKEMNPAFETEGIPATFLVSRDGRVVGQQIGASKWDTPQSIRRLAALLAADRPATGE